MEGLQHLQQKDGVEAPLLALLIGDAATIFTGIDTYLVELPKTNTIVQIRHAAFLRG
jgi:hypothetical protein